jgi:hypothetical protein
LLPKSTRKKLLEHNWEEIASKDSNPYQTLQRLRGKAIRAVNDLILIAQRLPDESQKEIFNYANIKKLVSAILKENELIAGNSTSIDNVRRIELAALLVRLGIMICIEQYQTKIEQDSILNDLTINHLLRARDICNAISFKIRLPQVEEEAEKEDLIYLFNWNRIEEVHESKVFELKGQDTKKFVRLLGDIYYAGYYYCPPDVINTISFDQTQDDPDSNIVFEFTDYYGGQCHGSISLTIEKKTAYLFMHLEDKRTLQHDFIIKMENENIYMYEKRDASKMAS